MGLATGFSNPESGRADDGLDGAVLVLDCVGLSTGFSYPESGRADDGLDGAPLTC